MKKKEEAEYASCIPIAGGSRSAPRITRGAFSRGIFARVDAGETQWPLLLRATSYAAPSSREGNGARRRPRRATLFDMLRYTTALPVGRKRARTIVSRSACSAPDRRPGSGPQGGRCTAGQATMSTNSPRRSIRRTMRRAREWTEPKMSTYAQVSRARLRC